MVLAGRSLVRAQPATPPERGQPVPLRTPGCRTRCRRGRPRHSLRDPDRKRAGLLRGCRPEGPPRPSPVSAQERRRYTHLGQRANHLIQSIGTPVVAAVNGHAIGAGLELALSADFAIVAEDARLRLPEVKALGINLVLNPLFSAQAMADAGGNTIAVGQSRDPEVRLLDEEFRLRRIVRWSEPGREVTSADVNAYRDRYVESRGGAQFREMGRGRRGADRPRQARRRGLPRVQLHRDGPGRTPVGIPIPKARTGSAGMDGFRD